MDRLQKHSSKRKEKKKKTKNTLKNNTIMDDIFRSVLITAIIMFFVLLLSLGFYLYQRYINYSITMLEEETRSITTETDHYFKDISIIFDIVSHSPILKDGNQIDDKKELILSIFTNLEKSNDAVNNVFVGYEDNSLLIKESVFLDDYSFQESEWYKNAINSSETIYSVGRYPTPEAKTSTKFIISKSISYHGTKIGVIGVDCNLDSVYELSSSQSMFKTKTVMLVNTASYLVLSNKPTEIDELILNSNPEKFNSEKTSFRIEHKGEKYQVCVDQISDSDWFIISRINYSEITDPIFPRVLVYFIALILITVVVSKIFAKVLGKTIAKPVIDVSLALQSLAKGNRNITPIDTYPNNEIGIMAESFNTYLKTTELLKADINELKETKADLSYSLSLLNASLESTEDGILIINNNGIITKWNQRFLKIWDISEAEINLKANDELLPFVKPKILNIDEFDKTMKMVREDPEKVSFDIIEFKNGQIIERYSFPQKVENEIVGRVWRYRDITQIKESEMLLKDSEEKHRVMFTKTVDAYCIMDNGVFIDVNESAQRMIGTTKEWLIGKTSLEISPKYQANGRLSEELIQEQIRIGFEKGKHNFKWNFLRYDGTEFPAEISLIKIRLKAKDLLLSIWRDVTEERKMAEKLKSSEQNFRLLFETMEDLIFITDYQGKIQYTNRSAQEKLGYSIDELTKMKLVDIHPEEFKEEIEKEIHTLLNGGRFDNPVPLVTKQGVIIPVETRAWLGKWDGMDCVFGLIKDVSKEQEALLMFNKIFDSNPNMIAITSYPDRKYVNVNKSFCRILGYTKEEIIGKTPGELSLKKEIDGLDKAVTKLFTDGYYTNIRLSVITKTGKVIEGLFSGEVIESNGKTFFLTVMTDITDIKQLDKKLRESERKYRLLFENMTSGFALHEMIYDEKGKAIDYRFLDINPAFEQYTGVKADTLIGRTVKEVLPNTENYWIDTYAEIIRTRQPLSYEQYSREFDKYFEVKAFSPESNRFAVIFSDTTSRVKALKDLEKEKEIALTATSAKSEFLANMSHEIRTPLNGIIGFTDLLLNTELSESQKQFTINANVSGKALLGIISDILDFSKIEAGKMELDIVDSSITEIMELAIDIVKFNACKKGLEVILNIPVDLPDRAMVDPIKLKQILINLLNNAVKFTEEGEIELSVKFTPNDNKSGRFIFSVKDTGIGIAEEASKRLFKAFTQADGSITRKYGGTGLGLVISNHFATQMGSHIDFVSEEGKGSEFYFAIDTEYVRKSTVKQGILKGNKVLIADLSSNFINAVKLHLEYWGIEVLQDTNFDELIESCTKNTFNAVMIDERLIDKDNFKQVNQLLTQNGETKKTSIIITYCPNDNIDFVNLGKGIKADHVMTKPLMINDLFSCMNGIFNDESVFKDKEKPAKHSITQLTSAKNVKILIAEDVEMNMVLIKTLVKKIIPAVQIREAQNGMEAVYLFKKDTPDLVLMDIQMPELDGLEATKVIRNLEKNRDKKIPIIALTAGAFSDDKEKCLNAGMDDFLTKPINVKQLTEMLEKYVNKN